VTRVLKTTKAKPPKKRPACRRRRVAGSSVEAGIVREEEDLGTMLGRIDCGFCVCGGAVMEDEEDAWSEEGGRPAVRRFVVEYRGFGRQDGEGMIVEVSGREVEEPMVGGFCVIAGPFDVVIGGLE